MRQCKCGGLIGEHQLTGERSAWKCRDCGRYEVVRQAPTDFTAFELWFADCIHMALQKDVVPEDYLWDLNNADDWRAMHAKGMTAFESVETIFRPGRLQ